MADRGDVMQRPFRSPRQQRNRRRWAVVGGTVALWAFLAYGADSVVAGTVLLVLLAVAAVLLMVALRCLGINRDHPWIQRMAPRSWRDTADRGAAPGGYRPEPFIPEPGMPEPVRQAAAPQPADSFYAHAYGGRAYADPGRPDPARPDPAWPDPVYAAPAAFDQARLDPAYAAPAHDQARLDPAYAAPAHDQARFDPAYAAPAHDQARFDPAAARTVVSESVTVAAVAQVPPLRLMTNGSVMETRISGARAGRSREAELRLPEEPTVSRMHAEFTFTDGRWHITNLGLNGVTLNGTPVTGEHALSDGDAIGWGTQPGALASSVEIGWDKARPAAGHR